MRSITRAAALAVVCCVLAAAPAAAAGRYRAVKIASFNGTTFAATPPTGTARLFVTTQPGVIRVIRHGKKLKRPFLDITRQVDSKVQRGLLSMAFAPDYSRSGLFYVFYVAKSDTVQIDEYRRSPSDPERAAPGTRRHVLNVGAGGDFHHGGQLQFGPDGYLWMSTGIGAFPERAQNLGDLHGKLLRINPRASGGAPYSVPADNPFVGVDGARPEIWAYGLRNPWRFSFDRLTGDLVIGDVGEKTVEEVDYLPHGMGAGSNFGFDVFEGDQQMIPGPAPASYVPPVIAHHHTSGATGYCAVMGGYVVRDRSLGSLYGRYLYHDLCQRTPRSAQLRSDGAHGDSSVNLHISKVVSFGQDNRGHLYAIGLDGGVYRIEPAPKK
jgi:glucose/arabinose dehydrogenase